MAETGTVWAIDIGNNSLKALCLSTERGVVEVIGFENIQHGKILSGSNVTQDEKEELIALSFRELVNKYDLSMEEIIVSVPSQNSFVRFVNLPPVEAKRIPEMVKFEAVQQIPFGINDVQWDWQLMSEPDSPEIKVGIFAIKNEIVNAALNPLSREDIDVSYVQIAPMALYNYLVYDRPDLVTTDNQAVVVINVGAENTDLVVCTKTTVWQRCILIGGNTFTQAIADTFKLNFDKAEKLKRTAPMSKYARQIFQAMRPVFTDLASEVQRSLGFYNSANPNTKIKKIIAMGGGAKLRGLLKYLQQTIQMPVERPDSFKRLTLGQGVSQAKFHESITDFGIVYGLAVQALGIAKIESNLLPRNIARAKAWATKGRYFIIAACLLLAVSVMSFGRTFWDKVQYGRQSTDRTRAGRIIRDLDNSRSQYEELKELKVQMDSVVDREYKFFEHRDIIPRIIETISAALPNEENNQRQAEMYKAFARGDAKTVMNVPRKDRKQIFITNTIIRFTTDLAKAQFPEIDLTRQSAGYGTTSEGRAQKTEQERQAEIQAKRDLARTMGEAAEVETAPTDSGFMIIITGYCPYGEKNTDVLNLLNPHDVTDRRNWGFVTRLEYMDELFDVNSPFKLYDKINTQHFDLVVKEIDKVEECPIGTGVEKEKIYPTTFGTGAYRNIQTTGITLIDPLTKEPIGLEVEKDANGQNVYKVNDHWFTLKMKFLWKDAPEPPEISLGI
ncbi:MAG: type IV pilus assembly protein PilM [Sedimentisphaerales bacterium]|nr:type IV pilus assembly protein PilM [Sedimentisphaerales bacterium]